MKRLILILLVSPLFSYGQQNLSKLLTRYNTGSISYISVEQLKMKESNHDSLILLDAREPEEYAVSHLKNAKLAGFKTFSVEKIESEIPDKSTLIVVYCSVGIRSETIATKLEKTGYMHVNNLYGGIFEWKNKGYPVIDSTGKFTKRVHAYSKSWGKWLKKGKKVYALEKN